MAALYDRSVTFGGLVVGTGNKTELLIGYTTLFGDSACAFNPIGDLYKSQVRQMAVAMGVPDAIVRKAPSADLWPGQTDESEGRFQLSRPRPAAVLDGRQAPVARRAGGDGLRRGRRRAGRPDRRGLGVQAPGTADREARTEDGRRRLPLSPAPPGLDTEVTAGRSARPVAPPAAAPAATGTGGTLYVVATPIGNLGDVTERAIEVLTAAPLVAAEDTRLTRRLFARHAHRCAADALPCPERDATPARAARPPARRHGPGDRHRRGDARHERSGHGPRRRVGRAAGGTVVPLPGASALLAAIAGSGIAGPRWAFEGFLPRSGRERRERIATLAADERGSVLFEAPGRLAATLAHPGGGVRPRSAGRRLSRADEAPRVDRPRAPRRPRGSCRER